MSDNELPTPEEYMEDYIARLRQAHIEAEALRIDALMLGEQPADDVTVEQKSLLTAAIVQLIAVLIVIGLVLVVWRWI